MKDWLERLGSLRRLALDTNAIIYFLDRTEPHFALMEALFDRAESGELEVVVPALVEMELLVGPYRSSDDAAVDGIRLLLDHFPGLAVAPIDRAAAQAAARLRAELGLATPDALIVGTALAAGCEAVVGNDRTCAARLTTPSYLLLSDFADRS
jgi:predicted nucleic acid-binding protein